MKEKERKEIIKKLKPFWKEYWKVHDVFYEEVRKIEKMMNKKLDLEIDLSFFHTDGACCGIGAENYADRESFSLIHDSELH